MRLSGRRRFIFVVAFAVVGLILQQIKVNQLVGSSVSFTLFDLFAPMSGAFLGGLPGIVAVFSVSLASFVWGGSALELAPLIRLFPTLFAVYYFSLPPRERGTKKILVIPVLAMGLFWAHPSGREVWYYALYWLIPLAAFFRRENLFLRALGATFTAHAVGGAAWIWAFNLPPAVWNSLIPVVAVERLTFALGIAISFIMATNLVSFLVSRRLLPAGLQLEPSYRLSNFSFRWLF